MVILKNILVATDFSEPSSVALAYGRELAKSYRATLHVLHVVENVMGHYSPEIGLTSPVLQEKIEAVAHRDLETLVSADDRQMLDIKLLVQRGPTVAGGIEDYARAQSIDLVVVGTHGRSGIQRVLMGSVAERVVRTAPCPVLAVRTPERDFVP